MKLKQLLLGTAMSLCLVANPISTYTLANNPIETSASEITPYASLVFSSYGGDMSVNYCYASAVLYDYGNVYLKVTLQKKNILGNWVDSQTGDPGKTYYNVLFADHNYPYPVTSSGSYRCKYTAQGVVNGVSHTVTAYSGVLTV